eukprot:tig00021432_g21222.t1
MLQLRRLQAIRRSRRHLPLLPLSRPPPAGCFSFADSRLCAGPGATCPSARFLARRLAGCFSVVDSRLSAGPGATYLSSRFPARRPPDASASPTPGYAQGPAPPAPPPAFPPAARRMLQLRRLQAIRRSRRHLPLLPLSRPPPAGCFSFADSRLSAGPGATYLSSRFPARRPPDASASPTPGYAQGPAPAPPVSPPAFPPAAAAARLATPRAGAVC